MKKIARHEKRKPVARVGKNFLHTLDTHSVFEKP
jgi:hypothetical protein